MKFCTQRVQNSLGLLLEFGERDSLCTAETIFDKKLLAEKLQRAIAIAREHFAERKLDGMK